MSRTSPRSPFRWPLSSLLALALLLLVSAAPVVAQGELRTEAETSGFTRYTAYESMRSYLAEVQRESLEMRLGVYGETHQGRELPYAIFARPSVTTPAEAQGLGKPILVLAAGVHGGERTLRESVLILVRELATPGTSLHAALDDLTILVVPQINPDGFSALPNPQRGNALGLDLNRDYMKLEQPEIQGYVQNILLEWGAHLFIDGHNGGSYPYHINYQCPSHAGADLRLTLLCDQQIFPAIDARLEADGYRGWYYQNGNETRWTVGGFDSRIGRNYGGLANMVGILFESPGGQTMADGVRSGVIAYTAVVDWSRENSELLLQTVDAARRETIALGVAPAGEVPVRMEYAPEEYRVRYLIAPGTGADRPILEIESDSLMKRVVVTRSRPRPWAYVLPRDAVEALELLQRHRVQVERLQEPTTVEVDAYTIIGLSYEAAYNHPAATRIEVGEVVTREVLLPTGSYIVRTGQLQGRVAAELLEAESLDGVVYWNRMDPWIPRPQVEAYQAGRGEAPLFPITKIMSPTALPTQLLR